MATRSYKNLSANDFKRLMIDIGKEHHFDGFDDGIVPESYCPNNFTGDWANSLFEVPKNEMK